jgi:hypothetical protein
METPSEVDTTVGNKAVENEPDDMVFNSTQACSHFGALWSDEAGTKSGCNTSDHSGSILQRFLQASFFPLLSNFPWFVWICLNWCAGVAEHWHAWCKMYCRSLSKHLKGPYRWGQDIFGVAWAKLTQRAGRLKVMQAGLNQMPAFFFGFHSVTCFSFGCLGIRIWELVFSLMILGVYIVQRSCSQKWGRSSPQNS